MLFFNILNDAIIKWNNSHLTSHPNLEEAEGLRSNIVLIAYDLL